MIKLTDDEYKLLEIMYDEGRANPYLIRQETGFDNGDINTILNRLGRAGLIRQVTRGLYGTTEVRESEINLVK